MKKLLAILLAILMLGSCFAVSASARDVATTSITFLFPKEQEGSFISLSPETSGTYKVTLSPSSAVDSIGYKLVNTADNAEIMPRGSFPQSIEYDLTAGETYHFEFNISSKNSGDAAIDILVESPTGETTNYAYTTVLGCDGYLPLMLISGGDFFFTPTVSGKHKVTISHTGTFNFYGYKIWKEVGISPNIEHIEVADHTAFPENAEYDFVAGEIYSFVFSIVNTGAAKFRFDIESPTGEKTQYDIEPDYFPSQAGKYKINISHSGTFDFVSYQLWKTMDDINFEEVASYDSFPTSAEYDLAEGEHLYFSFKISRDTKEAVEIKIEIFYPASTNWWDRCPLFVQWILKYLLFGWIWMH